MINEWYANSDERIVEKLLRIAAINDVENLRDAIRSIDPAFFDNIGVWEGLVRTPLMVAATSGSIGIMRDLISLRRAQVNVNRVCGPDRATALHCAASSASDQGPIAVYLLLDAGANPETRNALGLLPRDVVDAGMPEHALMRRMLTMDSSPVSRARDELFLQAYKVYECVVEAAHLQESCAFFHPGAGDRRRNPRQYMYSIDRCFQWATGCPSGDLCELAHGENESNFHPNQFKISLCQNAAACRDRACFMAHSQRERRLKNSAPWRRLPVMQLNEEQQWIFLNAARFTRYFLRRLSANLDHNI